MDYIPQFGQNVDQNTSLPADDAAMQLELKRRMRMAQALQDQAMPEGQMVSGHYVAPSWTQYLANAVGKYQGGQQEKAAINAYQQAQQTKQQKYADLLGETDNAKFQQGLAQMPEYAPELVKAKLSAMTKQENPMIVPSGATLYQGGKAVYTNPKEAADIFGKVNPGDFTPESLAKFSQTKNYQDLMPTSKPSEKSNDQKEFEFAKSQGFKGSFIDYKNQMTPYQKAELDLRRKDLTNKEAGKFDDATLNMLADQALAGDKSVFTGLGRGNQGANNIAAVRQRINQKMIDKGWSGADIAAKNAEFMGQLAGARAVGTRGANVELAGSGFENIVPIAQAASDKVSRSGFLPFGKAEIMFNEQTNNPDLSAFAAANNGLVNTYARSISPTGIPSVKDKEHAYKILSMAKDQAAYNAAVSTLQKEIQAEIQAPKHVREMQRQEISGHNQPTGFPSQDAIAAEIARRQGR